MSIKMYWSPSVSLMGHKGHLTKSHELTIIMQPQGHYFRPTVSESGEVGPASINICDKPLL